MKLSFRGVAYDYNPPTVAMVDGKVGGKFRGLVWRFRHLNEALPPLPVKHLTYRGIHYQTGTGAPRPTTPTTPVSVPPTIGEGTLGSGLA